MIDLAIDDRLFINNRLDAGLQELDLLFNTTNTELIGNPSFGINMEDFAWTLTPMVTELKKYIEQKIKSCYFLSWLQCNVNVTFVEGNIRSIYYIIIDVCDPETNIHGKREYHFF